MKSNRSQYIHKNRVGSYDRNNLNRSSQNRIHRDNLNSPTSSSSSPSSSQQPSSSPSSPSHNSPTLTTLTSASNLHLQRNTSLRTTSLQSLPESQLSAKPHAFSGAVLNPKQARDLTPKIVLGITHTLGSYALDNANAYSTHGPNSKSNESVNSHYSGSGGANKSKSHDSNHTTGQNNKEAKVQYTVWITEAWRCLGWAEPSAALFWEMATMYHTLHVAARSIEVEEVQVEEVEGEDGEGGGQYMGIQRTLSQSIPPILSCGSSQSMDSVENSKKKEKLAREQQQHQQQQQGSLASSPHHGSPNPNANPNTSPSSPLRNNQISSPKRGNNNNSTNNNDKTKNAQNIKASNASAKELPVWLVGMYLLLHCEEGVFRRNVSGEDDQRFDALMAQQGNTPGVGEIWKDGKGVDFGTLLNQPSLSLR